MNDRRRILVILALTVGLLAPAVVAQKAPAPPPAPPPSPGPSPAPGAGNPANSTAANPTGYQPTQPDEQDNVMFLVGHVATDDSTPVPNDALVERVCNNGVRQQVHATSKGDFSMQLGSRADSFVDASGDMAPQYGIYTKNSLNGLSRRELATCELRATVSGFTSQSVSLVDLDVYAGNVNVGAIVVHRTGKIEGKTLDAGAYKAPKDAVKAYEKGLEAAKKNKLADAGKHFEKAVQIYPNYARAWYQLGTVYQKEKQRDEARSAFTRATSVDGKYLPPYLSLASMAYKDENWPEVLACTGHVLKLDPLNRTDVKGYILDLDPVNFAEAYMFDAVANYKLDRIDQAEKSARQAEQHVDQSGYFPQVHLLLAEIYARKDNYPGAISEIRTYLELMPEANDAPKLREQLAKLEKLNSASSNVKPEQN